MVHEAPSPPALSSPNTSGRKTAMVALLPEHLTCAADRSLLETLERLLQENQELRSRLECTGIAADRLGMESVELKHLVRSELGHRQVDAYKPGGPGAMHLEVEGLRSEAELQSCVIARLQSQERQTHAELLAVKAQQTMEPKDPSLEAAVAVLERFQQYNEDLRTQLELKVVLVRQLEESERRLCSQLTQMCQAKAPDVSAAVSATLEVLRHLQDRNAELQRECEWQRALLQQLQDPPARKEVGDGRSTVAEASPLAEMNQQCAAQLATIDALRSRGEAVQQRLIQLADMYALDTRTPDHDADPMRLLRLLEDHLRVQTQAMQSMASIQDDPQEACEDRQVLGQRLTLLRRRCADLEAELVDTQRTLRDSEGGRDHLLHQFQDLQAQNVALAQQTERYSVAIRALEKQLDLTRAALEATRGKVTELTVQYEDHLAQWMTNVTDLGLEVEILRDAAGHSGTAKLLACDELFKLNARNHALREKVRRFHTLLQLRLTVFPGVLQNVNECRAALASHSRAAAGVGGPASPGRVAEAQLERAGAGLQGLIGSMLEVEHALAETQLLC